MSPIPSLVLSACRTLRLTGMRLLVGVSGGADSVALLLALRSVRQELSLELRVAHLNHQLRGTAADDDARWVETLACRLSIPCSIGARNIGEVAASSGRGIEEAARDERYQFLQEVAREFRCAAIAVAHTADDQAETILHHIIRGTGLAGLAGIPRERDLGDKGRLVRPLLDATRDDIIAFLAEHGQDFREDETNRDESLTRNRLRRRLLPEIRREYNTHLFEALCRLGQQAAETQTSLVFAAAELLERILESSSPVECRLTWQKLAKCPRHLVREVLSLLWRQSGWPRQGMSFDHWDRLAGVLLEGGAADFPGGISAERNGRLFTVVCRPVSPPST